MRQPAGIFVDVNRQRYYVADSGNGRLLSFDRDGGFRNALRAGGGLGMPRDLARAADGRWWVLDKQTNQVAIIDLAQRSVSHHTVLRRGVPVLPGRLALAKGRCYILDDRDGAVVETDESLDVLRTYVPEGPMGAIDFALTDDRLYTLGRGESVVTIFSLDDGGRVRTITLGRLLALPVSLTVAPDGSLLVLDRGRGEVAAFSPEGDLRYTFCHRGRSQGKLFLPATIRLSPWGDLAIVDEGNGRVEIYRR